MKSHLKWNLLMSGLVLCALQACGPVKTQAPVSDSDIKIEKIVESSATDLPKIPLIKDEKDESWHGEKQPPVGEAKSDHAKVQCWVASTHDSLLFHVEVVGPPHENAFHERNLWRGDCLYLRIDGRGDTTPDDIAKNNYGIDDALLICGLGANGPEGQLTMQGLGISGKDCSDWIRGIHRDEATKTTSYDVAVPWSALKTAYGQSSSIGLAFNAAEAMARPNKQDATWGAISDAPGKPFPLNRLALTDDGQPFVTIAPKKTRVIDGSDIQVVVAARTSGTSINASIGEKQATFPITGSSDIQRVLVSIPAADFAEVDTMNVKVGETAASLPVATPDVAFHRLVQCLELLLKTSPNEIVTRHLEDTERIVTNEHQNLSLEMKEHPERVEAFMEAAETILSKLPAERFDWDAHQHRAWPVVFAFISNADQTLQFASLQMPYDWKPDQTYPLTVYLHGYGPSEPMSGLATAFDNSRQDTLFGNDELDPRNVPAVNQGFILAPWGRGNGWYRGPAEADVWQAIKWVESNYKIDPDRRYLTGFSMGGSGASNLAAGRPDYWAGVNIASGYGPWSMVVDPVLLANAGKLPMVISYGELEEASMHEGAQHFADQLHKAGNKNVKVAPMPNLPHTYPHADYINNVAWLMQFHREKQNSFSYTATSWENSGRNGITVSMPGYIDQAKLPHFTCKIDGNTLHIDSTNCETMRVDLAEVGIDSAQNAVIIWNGKKAYDGPVKVVKLGDDH
jgi:predicted esterase